MSLDLDVSKSTSASLSKLTELARQAYEQKRTKDCLDLTRAILLIEPENVQAQLMRSSLQSDLQQVLENAQAVLRNAESSAGSSSVAHEPPSGNVGRESVPQAPVSDDSQRQRKAGKRVEAVILNNAESSAGSSSVADEPPSGNVEREFVPKSVAQAPVRDDSERQRKAGKWVEAGILAVVAIVLGVGIFAFIPTKTTPNPVEAAAVPDSAPTDSAPTVTTPQPPGAVPSGQVTPIFRFRDAATAAPAPEARPLAGKAPVSARSDVPAAAKRTQPAAPVANGALASSSPIFRFRDTTTAAPAPVARSLTGTVPVSARSDVPAAAKRTQPVAKGVLAISSPTSIDIYKDDTYLGSAPISLDLPAGTHTLEYRHGNLRRFITHVVNSNETTKSMITFDVNVQINSKPWAEVFLEGIDRKDLGQTPLSGVRVPIGSVLVFENPRFQTKRYRVTGNETGIQIVFP
jgi:hypothetical protein